ncbi:DUF4942 domain-containing protein [Duganella vulcania]|uniref:DUF4942 domain-containing protein n=1 Tax=Duganella vulcania TaxID=2692166 RepID=A0A845GFE2_9BURK|nr:DUF4942 domain-containing protein [Duganella vulcania]MYM92661.1 DUF4942 domain-containing protein [Duganella vulcania]
MDFQFYPTPIALAHQAWHKFKNRNFIRVMDPSAGEGHLLKGRPASMEYHFRHRDQPFDVCEIDAKFHPTLREQKHTIVGHDFLQYTGGAWLTHIIMNPPFAYGVQHVLHAWDILWDGEIVAIINAETIRNPNSAQRKQLVRLIEQNGEVEFIENAFNGPDAERPADVVIALVYLRKQADIAADITGNLFNDLRQERQSAEGLAAGFKEEQQLALPNRSIDNMVLAFNAAVSALRAATFAQAKATYYASLLGQTMEQTGATSESNTELGAAPTKNETRTLTLDVMSVLHEGYKDLKNRAWTGVLKSTSLKDRLSSQAQQRLTAEFVNIQQLEFTVNNIYGFLLGVIEKQGDLQIEMACDVFDSITKYHSDNAVYFKGWKSNDRHRTCGMRLRTHRFVLPRFTAFKSELDSGSYQRLADFDKVFAMLDGKLEPEVSLVHVFKTHYRDLCSGARISSSYFDVRYYPGAGTIHFFARDKAIVDRLNRMVGKQRQWLPPNDRVVNDVFWQQYEGAEKLDKEIREEISNIEKTKYRNHFGHCGAVGSLASSDAETRLAAQALVAEATTTVLQKHDMDYELQLSGTGAHGQQILQLVA